jgi:hypothetical protein
MRSSRPATWSRCASAGYAVPTDALDEYVLRLRGLIEDEATNAVVTGRRPQLKVVKPGDGGP